MFLPQNVFNNKILTRKQVWLKVRILTQAVENTQVVEENVYNEVFGKELYEKTYQRHAFWTTVAVRNRFTT